MRGKEYYGKQHLDGRQGCHHGGGGNADGLLGLVRLAHRGLGLPDADGLKAKALYPRWEKLVQLVSVNADDTLSGLPSMSACNLLVTIGV